jgi:beta-lactamase class A
MDIDFIFIRISEQYEETISSNRIAIFLFILAYAQAFVSAINDLNNVSIKINEKVKLAHWDLQFQNWTTPNAANTVLASFYYNKKNLLSKKSYEFIWITMKETQTGKDRLRGQLPGNTIVAHKTGTSGANEAGLTAAVNDIGIVFLPDKKYFFISVFITESKENAETNAKIIADISKAAWDYFKAPKK